MDALILLAFGIGVLTLMNRDPPGPEPYTGPSHKVDKVGEARGSCVYLLSQAMGSGTMEPVGYIVGNSSATSFQTSSGRRYVVAFTLDGVDYQSVSLYPTEAGAFGSIPYPEDLLPDMGGPSTTDWAARGFGSGGPFDVNAPADGW